MSIFELKDVRMRYFTGYRFVEALKGINASFDSGITIIHGKSGSGKTTLLNILAGYEEPTEGSVIYDRHNLYKELDMQSLHSKEFGFVFQKFNLIDQFDVKENIMLPMKFAKNKDMKIFNSLIERLELKNLLARNPQSLSGGEQQRVAIVRALVNHPKVIFADEPTGNLDVENADRVINILIELCREYDASLIMVTHDLDLLKYADNTYEMVDGMLKEE